ncbi:MAG: DNA primase [Clostridia bacterium]|nr:DNA primase [Clostridia bacterium]
MARIPQNVVEEIKYRSDIVRVVSEYVELKRAGRNMTGLCPFHSEKTPSFTVFPGTSSFYCFGCGAAGDVITFVMRIENLDYGDALRMLASKCGVDIVDEDKSDPDYVPRDRLLSLNRDAARFFVSELRKSPSAQKYAAERKLSPSLISHFGIGYAPDDWGVLTRTMKAKGYTDRELERAFLSAKGKRGDYDIFRNRLMFPIIDKAGSVIGFGGRILTDEKPKYLNTTETPVFSKGRHLFALNFARLHCAEEMILCEGYMDVVSLHGAGFENAVATCGTAMTEDQARLMKKYTKRVLISYDADEAGQKAAEKAFTLLDEVGLDARLIKVRDAKDPDEYIKKFGAGAFRDLIRNKTASRFDFKFSSVTSKYDITTPDGQVSALRELEQYIAGLPGASERDVYIRQVAAKMNASVTGIQNDVSSFLSKKAKGEKRDLNENAIRGTAGYRDRVNPERIENLAAATAEEAILGILTIFPENIPSVISGELKLTTDDFVTGFNRKIFGEMVKYGADFDIGLIGGELTPDEMSRLVSYSVERQQLTSNGPDVLAECVGRLRALKNEPGMTVEEIIEKKRREEKENGR